MMDVDPDMEIIDRLGQSVVADELGISREAVSKWWRKGVVPDERRDELRQMVGIYSDKTGQPWNQPPSTTWPMVVDQQSTGQPGTLIDLTAITGSDARAKAEAAIAERMTILVGERAERAQQALSDDATDQPVRFYGLRLGALFAVDFPNHMLWSYR